MRYEIGIGDKIYRLELEKAHERWLCRLDGREITVDAALVEANRLSIVVNGKSFDIRRENAGESQRVFLRGTPYDIALRDPRSLNRRKPVGTGDAGLLNLTATMPGKIIRVLAKEGDRLQAGMGIVVIEAMKMQNELRSPRDGTLIRIVAQAGMNVNAGDVLAILE